MHLTLEVPVVGITHFDRVYASWYDGGSSPWGGSVKLYKFAFVPFALLAACGGGGTTIDLNGKTPEQQADTVADAICSPELDCSQPNFDIAFDQETQTYTCTVTFEAGTQDDYDSCYMDVHDGALDTFTNCGLSDADLNKIESCFNMALAQGCVTQAQADDYCAQWEDGVEDPVLLGHETPAVCDEVDAIIEACTPA